MLSAVKTFSGYSQILFIYHLLEYGFMFQINHKDYVSYVCLLESKYDLGSKSIHRGMQV